MAEKQETHRQELEQRVVEGNISAQRRGQNYALALALAVLAVAGVMMVAGLVSLGFWLMVADLLVLCGVFITGKVLSTRERKQKRDELQKTIGPSQDDERA